MDAVEIIQVIESGAQQFFNGLLQEVRMNLGTTYYRRLSNEELARRMTVVYKGLENWLVGPNEAAVQAAGEDLGKRRFEESIPLGQVVLSLLLEEKYLRKYIADQGVSLGDEWSKVISDYFRRLIYAVGQGYEAALAHSNRHALGNVPVEDHPHHEARRQPEPGGEIEISRGGEIGEVSG
jgi:hypothetical protein